MSVGEVIASEDKLLNKAITDRDSAESKLREIEASKCGLEEEISQYLAQCAGLTALKHGKEAEMERLNEVLEDAEMRADALIEKKRQQIEVGKAKKAEYLAFVLSTGRTLESLVDRITRSLSGFSPTRLEVGIQACTSWLRTDNPCIPTGRKYLEEFQICGRADALSIRLASSKGSIRQAREVMEKLRARREYLSKRCANLSDSLCTYGSAEAILTAHTSTCAALKEEKCQKCHRMMLTDS